ncbi:MAG: hypothetical protein UX08_C0025G0003 [Candidatus Collierbacteria bacterium GW2011_GWB1_45_35]|uniref:Uncharacterized protein n=1 Tax=Candidatus Collierbacteria bacterium GW2011_GWB2_45_17 TaxID=1618388 RepID=A0A837IPF9_9BACT|nr:MAG: hypothetical protein UW48_C0017G0004 [Microgenomates group bacterium GW2011_GWC1_44_23]KKT94573.1 MAG: hypothetical protein UW96_C0019G0018 [Candidatus Collierbacteria bacterium GW2011_GWA1_45_15]KKT99645.1 MAG: hypothetical protein UX01_C0008G0013 [Candidatus Collierbacteria bacterium GW2011_GWB2_45_17]KKU04462.1 MAG: hypothetical protein UX08_C0025G0003 [Candidatus Collierbacteria bacterium GW2011_GWB1_45_35]KKU07226.1 MAG: hypothetical protein UX11_C0018G0003 [Candidatus Collierbacte
MKILLQGSMAITTGNTTVIANLGEADQVFPITEFSYDVDIAEELINKGVREEDDSTFTIPGNTIVMATYRPIFRRLEITPFSKEEGKLFFLNLQSDPDIKSRLEQVEQAAKNRSRQFVEDLHKVLELLPEDGATSQLVKHLEEAQWAQALLEIIAAIQVALPEKWEALSDLITPSGLAWLTGKLK